jgi:DNA polymerase III delta prime subunit
MLTFDKNFLHHAYGIAINHADGIQYVEQILAKDLGITFVGNPDVLRLKYDLLGVDEARAIGQIALTIPLGPRKILMIQANSFTAEAQNALLKLLEEPAANTHFFILVKNISVLLPTLRSRLAEFEIHHETRDTVRAKLFFESTPAIRLSILKEIIDNKDKQAALQFLDDLESYLKGTSVINNSGVLKQILISKKYLRGNGSSTKMILEHMALVTKLRT